MKTLLIAILVVVSSFLFINPTLADICSDVEQKSGLNLNEAECYVLEQVEKGEVANFKKSQKWVAKFQEKFSKKENRTLSADFLEDLLTGTLPKLEVSQEGVRIRNARINQGLSLEDIEIPHTISLVSCHFKKEVSFKTATFSGKASFFHSTFSGKASFDYATFSGEASFPDSTFSGKASFSSAIFTGETSFSSAIFTGETSFSSAIFIGKASFDRATFSGWGSHFDGATFSGVASFQNATFSRVAYFQYTTFSRGAYFKYATFSGGAYFQNTTFSGVAYFFRATFFDYVSFLNATLSGETIFNQATFTGKGSFTNATFSESASFWGVTFFKEADFSSCDFTSRSNFKNALFHDMVIFDDVSGFSKMSIEWKYSLDKFGYEKNNTTIKLRELKNYLKYNETFYIALIKNYREMGWFKEADDCYYTYRVEKRKHRLKGLNEQSEDGENNPTSFSRLWQRAKLYGELFLLDLTFGYGVKPKKIFWTFVVFWAFFIPVYIVLLRHQWIKNQSWFKNLHKRFFRATVFSLDTLTPGVNFRSESTLPPYTFSHSDFRKPIFNFCIRFQQILGWYWAALFLILFSKIWIR